jgi:hypothetical protein
MGRQLTRPFFLPIFLWAAFTWLAFSHPALAQIRHQAHFSETDLVVTQERGFDVLNMEGCLKTSDPGHPGLPVKFVHLALPSGTRAARVSVSNAYSVSIPGSFLVHPSQPGNKTDGSTSEGWVEPDRIVYNSDSPCPAEMVKIVSQGNLGGVCLITLELSPLQYRPKSRKLLLHTQLEIKVELEPSPKVSPSSRLLRNPERRRRLYQNIIRSLVENAQDIPSFTSGEFPPMPAANGEDGEPCDEYLVVTTSALKPAFLPLVEWKTKKGTKASIACLDSILANYSGRDDAEKLRSFLVQAYQNGTIWVLLGGDEDVVPIRYAYPTNTSSVPSNSNQQICDLYFSDVDGEWDLDNDGVWGEPQHDSPDIYPDLFVGRVPASNAAEAEAFVVKLLYYERNPGGGGSEYLTRVLWACSDQMRDFDGGTGQHNLLSPSLPPNFYQDLTTLIESPAGDAENPVSPEGQTCVDVMNQGWGIMGVLAHGKSSGFVAKSNLTNGTPKSWVLTLPGANDGHGHMPDLVNQHQYGIAYSISCSQSAIDVDKYPFLGGEPCVGEFYPLAEQKGGVAFLGYSRWGWVSVSYKLFEQFLLYLFDDSLGHHLGVAEALSRCAYPGYRDIDYGHNLSGDPEMPVWTEPPSELMVIHPEEVPMGENTIHLSVSSQRGGIEGAQVCLTLRGQTVFLGQTAEDGNILCPVNLDDLGEMTLIVSKSNFIPYEDSITVSLAADVEDDEAEKTVASFELCQNNPNPFNPVTDIRFSVPGGGTPVPTTLRIYNILGQKVRTLVDEPKKGGIHQAAWDGKDDNTNEVSSGIYFYTLQAGEYRETKKMILMK